VEENFATKREIKHEVHIPRKLSSSLGREICSPFWKKIIESIEKKEVETILEIVKTIDKQKGFLCLPHPFIKTIDTFAARSVRQGMCNFIFFYDSNSENQWILCQCTSFVDAIFSSTYSGKHKSSVNDELLLAAIKRVFKAEDKADAKQYGIEKAIFSGYLLDQTRPYHHFYDQLKWLIHLQTKKPIVSDKSFFAPKYFKRNPSFSKNYPTFSMFPLVIGSNQLGIKLDKYSDQMEKIVYKDSLKGLYGGIINYRWNQAIRTLKQIPTKNKTLTLWFGISGQKRIWVEQEDFLPALVQQLKPWFDSFVFCIDGYTQYECTGDHPIKGIKQTGISQDLEIVNSISQKLLPFSNTHIVNLVGQTYRKKIQQCQSVDFFIANAGAGQLTPHRFCKKPGILHSNEKHCVFSMGINNTTVKLVNKSLVNDVGNLFTKGKNIEAKSAGLGFISYSIDVQVIVNMTADMLKLKK
jgi:hypothetical protein